MIRVIVALVLASCVVSGVSQTGGPYDVSHNVVASGGGSRSVGGSLSIDGTVGQSWAGDISAGGGRNVRSGFWSFGPLIPTAAGTSISGQIRTQVGVGIQGVTLVLTNIGTGTVFTVRSTSFGYYRFDDVPTGQTYLLSIRSRRYAFDPPERLIVLRDEALSEDFVVVEE
jgi:hypothetical protein